MQNFEDGARGLVDALQSDQAHCSITPDSIVEAE
jgi:hypothetical protein